MEDGVRKHYEPRPNIIKNSADNVSVDVEVVKQLSKAEKGIGFICTEQQVSVTIGDNE